MLRHLLPALIFTFVLSFTGLHGQDDVLPPVLTESAEVSVVTCSPGTEIYELFGHSAFRVRDPQTGLDRAYNYGTFEFGPDFVWLFLRGKLRYLLNSYSFRRFQAEYVSFNRGIKEQVLNLSLPEKQAVYDFLNTNELPENKYYQYDFFYDNCATRERDVLKSVLGDRLRFKSPGQDTLGSLRDMIHIYFKVVPWASFGVDIALGLPADKAADQNSSMFLPDYLYEALRAGEVLRGDPEGAGGAGDRAEPLVAREAEIYRQEPGGGLEPPFFTPVMACWLLFALGLGLSLTKFGRSRAFRIFDSLYFLILGILGTVIVLFWTGTDHQATYQNLNLLWLWPTHFLFAFMLWVKPWQSRLAKYAGICALWYLAYLSLGWLLPQYIHPAFYPLILLAFTRLVVFRMQE